MLQPNIQRNSGFSKADTREHTSSTRKRVDHRAVLRAGGRSTRLRVLMLRIRVETGPKGLEFV